MTNNIENRQMPIFLSSTFRDMQEERDELIKKIFPQLKDLAAQRLVTLTPIDLRWGITEEESKTGRIIELCLQEIERCQPFFIGILGSHYGWCPNLSDLKGNSMLLDQYDWLKKDIAEGLSITEIEMQFAVFRRKHHANAFFFIKNNCFKGQQENSKMNRLVNHIKSKGLEFTMESLTCDDLSSNQCHYAYYDSSVDLGQLVQKVVEKLLDSNFPVDGEEDRWARESRAQQAYLHSLTDIYVPQEGNEFNTYLMNQMQDRYFMITSDKKCFYGKSAFVANWIMQCQSDNSHNFIFHSLGVGYLGGNYKLILERICSEVAQLYGLVLPVKDDYGYELNYTSVLTNLLKKISGKKPLFIILDGLQHLSDFDGSKNLEWLPVVPDNVTIIATAPYHDATREVFERRYGYVSCLHEFKQEEERRFVEAYLGKYGKKLSTSQTDILLEAYSAASLSPVGTKDILTLKSLLNELVVFGSYELLDQQIAYYCEDNLVLFYPRMFERMESDFGREEVQTILSLIVYSREGLRESEIIDISRASIMQWSYIHYAISHLLALRNGKYYIDKSTIIRQIVERYAKEEKSIRLRIVNYFVHQSGWEVVEECLFQYYHLKDFDSLYKTLLNIEVFSYLYKRSGVSELLPYWTALYNSGGGRKYSIRKFAELDVPLSEESAHTLADIAQFTQQVLGDEESAKILFIQSKNLYESICHADYEMAASVYAELGMYDEALKNLEKSLNIARLLYNNNDTYYPELLSHKASVLFRKGGREEEAIEIWKEALEFVIQAKGENNAIALGIYRNLAIAYRYVNDDDFKDYIEKTISISNKIWGEKHVLLADAFFLYGVFHERHNHIVEALGYYKKALNIYTRWYPQNHDRVLLIRESIDKLQTDDDKSAKESFFDFLFGNLPDRLKGDKENNSSMDKEFKDVMNFYEGIVDDLYLVDEGWEFGMREYEYAFKYRHDCYIGNDRYVFGPNSNHVYIYVDSSGMYNSCDRTFDNLKDAQVHYLIRFTAWYEQFCAYKNL